MLEDVADLDLSDAAYGKTFIQIQSISKESKSLLLWHIM